MEKTPEKGEYKVTNIEEIKQRLAKEFNVEKIEGVEKGIEKKEIKEDKVEEERKIRERLEKEVELMQTSSPQLQDEAQEKAQEIKGFDAERKLRGLLDLAQSKSLSFAIATARAMGDAYILDVFHDLLVKGEFYKRFIK